jgi:hypothetical protein
VTRAHRSVVLFNPLSLPTRHRPPPPSPCLCRPPGPPPPSSSTRHAHAVGFSPHISSLPLALWTGPSISPSILAQGSRRALLHFAPLVRIRSPRIEPAPPPSQPPLAVCPPHRRNPPMGATYLEPPPSQLPLFNESHLRSISGQMVLPLTSPSPLRCCRCLPLSPPTTGAHRRRGNATVTIRTCHPTGVAPPR